jgi:hypothetical protein
LLASAIVVIETPPATEAVGGDRPLNLDVSHLLKRWHHGLLFDIADKRRALAIRPCDFVSFG